MPHLWWRLRLIHTQQRSRKAKPMGVCRRDKVADPRGFYTGNKIWTQNLEQITSKSSNNKWVTNLGLKTLITLISQSPRLNSFTLCGLLTFLADIHLSITVRKRTVWVKETSELYCWQNQETASIIQPIFNKIWC